MPGIIEDIDARAVREQELNSGVITYHVQRVRVIRDALNPSADEARLHVGVFRYGRAVSRLEVCGEGDRDCDRLVRNLILDGRY